MMFSYPLRAQNYADLEDGFPATRKLLVRVNEDIKPATRKIELVLPSGGHFEIKGKSCQEVVEMDAGGTLPLTVVFRKPAPNGDPDDSNSGNLQDWLCIHDKLSNVTRHVPLRAIYIGDSCSEDSYFPQDRPGPFSRASQAAVATHRNVAHGMPGTRDQGDSLVLDDEEEEAAGGDAIVPFRTAAEAAAGLHGEGGAGTTAGECRQWDAGSGNVDPVRLLEEADELLHACDRPLAQQGAGPEALVTWSAGEGGANKVWTAEEEEYYRALVASERDKVEGRELANVFPGWDGEDEEREFYRALMAQEESESRGWDRGVGGALAESERPDHPVDTSTEAVPPPADAKAERKVQSVGPSRMAPPGFFIEQEIDEGGNPVVKVPTLWASEVLGTRPTGVAATPAGLAACGRGAGEVSAVQGSVAATLEGSGATTTGLGPDVFFVDGQYVNALGQEVDPCGRVKGLVGGRGRGVQGSGGAGALDESRMTALNRPFGRGEAPLPKTGRHPPVYDTCTCTYTYIHTCIHTSLHTSSIHPSIHTYIHTYAYT